MDKKNVQNRKADTLYNESQIWMSKIHFIEDEIVFIQHLLDSYIFEPDTHNLFERLQEYLEHLKTIIARTKDVKEQILTHEKILGGILECKNEACDMEYYQKHKEVGDSVAEYLLDFQKIKTEIFEYAGSILKKRKK